MITKMQRGIIIFRPVLRFDQCIIDPIYKKNSAVAVWSFAALATYGRRFLHWLVQSKTHWSNLRFSTVLFVPVTLPSIPWIFFLPGRLLRFIPYLGNPGLFIGPVTSLTFCLNDYWAWSFDFYFSPNVRSGLLLSTLE